MNKLDNFKKYFDSSLLYNSTSANSKTEYTYIDFERAVVFEISFSEDATDILAHCLPGKTKISLTINNVVYIDLINTNPDKTAFVLMRGTNNMQVLVKDHVSQNWNSEVVACREQQVPIVQTYLTSSSHLIVLTRNSYEIHLLDLKRTKRSFSEFVCAGQFNWIKVSEDTTHLVFSKEANGLDLNCFCLDSASVNIPAIQGKITPSKDGFEKLQEKDVSLFKIYNSHYLVVCGVTENYLCLYHINSYGKGGIALQYTLRLSIPCSDFTICLIDNLIVYFNKADLDVLIFDINFSINSGTIKACKSIIVSDSSQTRDKYKSALLSDCGLSSSCLLYNNGMFLDRQNSCLYQLKLNYKIIKNSFGNDHNKVFDFLSHRVDEKSLFLQNLFDLLFINHIPIDQLKSLYSEILRRNECYLRKSNKQLEYNRTPANYSSVVLTAEELVVEILLPLLRPPNDLNSADLLKYNLYCEAVICTCVASIVERGVKVCPRILECLHDTMIKLGRETQFVMLLSSDMFSVDKTVASYLTLMTKRYPSYVQPVMEICYRSSYLDYFLDLIMTFNDTLLLKRFINQLNQSHLYHFPTNSRVKLLQDLKVDLNYYNDVFPPTQASSLKIDTLKNYLSTLTIKQQ